MPRKLLALIPITVLACSPAPAPTSAPSVPLSSGPAPVSAAVAECTMAPPDGSWSLREREQWSSLLRQTKAYLDETNRRCGTQICASIAYESFRGHFAAQNNAGLDGEGVDHVVAPIAVVHQLCEEGAMQTDAVRAKLHRVDIRWGAAGRSSWSLDGGVLATSIQPAAESSFDYRAEMRGPNGIKQRL